jgi:hypothetical protein
MMMVLPLVPSPLLAATAAMETTTMPMPVAATRSWISMTV